MGLQRILNFSIIAVFICIVFTVFVICIFSVVCVFSSLVFRVGVGVAVVIVDVSVKASDTTIDPLKCG